MRSHHRIGRAAGALALLSPSILALQIALLAIEAMRASGGVLLGRAPGLSPHFVPVFYGAAALACIASLAMLVRMRRVVPGTLGRSRTTVLSTATLVAQLSLGGLVAAVTRLRSFGLVATMLATQSFDLGGFGSSAIPVAELLPIAFAALGVAVAIVLVSTLSFWFLIAPRVRARIWAVIDLLLFAAFVVASHTLPLSSSPDNAADTQRAAVRLLVTTLFAIRMLARLIPLVLDLIERAGFDSLIAARLLRAGKSGFLTVIGFLSILAVSVSSCALTTTLSVMGGFRGDLKRKILGQNAHIVVDRESGKIEGWQPVLRAVERVPDVRGATPYVNGEVMIASATNRAGAVLRGIDVRTVGSVTDLPRTLQSGKLEYLESPGRLLEETRKDRAAVRTTGTLLRDIDQALRDLEPPSGASPTKAPARTDDDPRDDGLGGLDALELPLSPHGRDPLPGILLGRELARSLRVFVGDEVDVVSPLGELGPTGPMPKSRPFRIAGVFYSGMYEFDMKFAYVSLPTAQEFLTAGGGISGIEIKVDEVEHAPEVANTIRSALSSHDVRVRDWKDLNKNLFGALALERVAMFLVLAIAILVASFCIFASLMLMVQEKGRQIGVLKAIGATNASIVRIFMLEGLFIGVFGAATGLGAGYVGCFALERIGLPIQAEVYYIDRLPVNIDPREFLAVGLTAVVMGVLITILPATLASRLNPVEALRYE